MAETYKKCPHGTDWHESALHSPGRRLRKGDRVCYPEASEDSGTVVEVRGRQGVTTIRWDSDGELDPATRHGRLFDMECGCTFVQLAEPKEQS